MSNLDSRKKSPQKAAALPPARQLYAISGGASAVSRPDVAAPRQAPTLRGAPPIPARRSGPMWLLQRLRAIAQWVTDVRARRRAAHELARLDDRMLADIGLTRSDIPHVLWRLPTESEPRRLR